MSYNSLPKYLLEGLPHLEGVDSQLSETLIKLKKYLRLRIVVACSNSPLEPEDLFQQLIMKLIVYSKAYKSKIYSYNSVNYRIIEDEGSICKLDGKHSFWIRKELLDMVHKMNYTKFIKLKIVQEIINIRDSSFRQKRGHNLAAEDGQLYSIYKIGFSEEDSASGLTFDELIPDINSVNPEESLIRSEYLKGLRVNLSPFGERVLDSVDYEPSTSDNLLVRPLKLYTRKLQFARREVKKAIKGDIDMSGERKPIHLKASAIR